MNLINPSQLSISTVTDKKDMCAYNSIIVVSHAKFEKMFYKNSRNFKNCGSEKQPNNSKEISKAKFHMKPTAFANSSRVVGPESQTGVKSL